jgi:hypothetical protein
VRSGRYRGAFDLYPGSSGGVTVVNALLIDEYVGHRASCARGCTARTGRGC